MEEYYDDINELARDIAYGKISKEQACEKIQRYKEKYGEDIFPKTNFVPKGKPWDKEYLAYLKKNMLRVQDQKCFWFIWQRLQMGFEGIRSEIE